jgi:transcriptional regulator with XRE-family HTH domain
MRDLEAIDFLQILLKQGWTRKGIAEALGVRLETVYRWLRGESAPRRRDVLALKYLAEGIEDPR